MNIAVSRNCGEYDLSLDRDCGFIDVPFSPSSPPFSHLFPRAPSTGRAERDDIAHPAQQRDGVSFVVGGVLFHEKNKRRKLISLTFVLAGVAMLLLKRQGS